MPAIDAKSTRRRIDDARWEHFPHDADIGVRGIGKSPSAAFEQGAMALTAAISDPECVAPKEEVAIRCTAPDVELLFVEWLNALIYEMATRHMLFSRFSVSCDDHNLDGTAWGETIDINRHRPAAEVKGATYTELHVRQIADRSWVAECVVDV